MKHIIAFLATLCLVLTVGGIFLNAKLLIVAAVVTFIKELMRIYLISEKQIE